jgi:hypothetical protein
MLEVLVSGGAAETGALGFRLVTAGEADEEGLALALDSVRDGDEVFEHDGRHILLIDGRAASLVEGLVLDVVENAFGRKQLGLRETAKA